MGKSQQTFNKKEKEKKRRKKKKDKLERKEQRKLEKLDAGKKTLEDMFVYLDENGNLVSTPPDPAKKKVIKAEDIVLGATQREDVVEEIERSGKVKFFNHDKGYGFLIDKKTKESIFTHINNCYEGIKENHMVKFEIEMGPKGPNAVNVEQVK